MIRWTLIAAPWLAEPDDVAAALGTDRVARAHGRRGRPSPRRARAQRAPLRAAGADVAPGRSPSSATRSSSCCSSRSPCRVGAWVVEGAEGLPFDALVIAVIVVANAVLGVVQERKAEDAVAALQQISAPTASVVRDGEQQRVPAREVVPGDVLVLAEGDTVPADARLVQVSSLHVAEAALTGESEAVTKTTATLRGPTALGDRTCMVFGGTAVDPRERSGAGHRDGHGRGDRQDRAAALRHRPGADAAAAGDRRRRADARDRGGGRSRSSWSAP